MPQKDLPEIPSESRASRKNIKPPRRISETYLHNAGLAYLQRFAASSGRFHNVMKQKVVRSCRFHSDQSMEDCLKMVDELTAKFLRAGLLDDSAYARGSVTSLRRRGLSRHAIIEKLKAKGLGMEDIETALAGHASEQEMSDTHAELAAALSLARRKKIGPFRKAQADLTDQKRELQKMAAAGFSYDTARKALEMPESEAHSIVAAIGF